MAEAASRSYSLAAYGRLLKTNREFRLLWLSQVVSELGDWLYAVAIYSLLLELTGEAKSVGIAVVLQLLPQVFVAPMAGVLNDRLSRRAIMIFADCVRVFIVLAMLLVTSASMVWLVWVLLFFETVMWALFEPGRSAIVPNIARDEAEMMVANALSSTTWAINFAIGSGLGGLVAYHFGRPVLFVLNAMSFVVSAALLAAMNLRETHTEEHPRFGARDLVDFKPALDGLRYIRRDSRLVATLMVKAGMGLLGAHWVILPLYGERIFALPGAGGGALSMSLLLGARGVGALIGSFSSGYWAKADERRMRAGIFWAFVVAAVSYGLLSGAPTLALACAAVAMGHAGTSMAWVFSTTMLQSMTEDGYRGRVFSADFSGLFLVMSLLSLVASMAVDAGLSVRTVALITGGLGLVPALTWWWSQRFWRVAQNR
ncbi:MAG: MFS transporter [Acidobacteria bacterium]|nr:MFS transporter [Acidobacteriota bacterium]